MSLRALFYAYLIGGVTFIPLVLGSLVLFIYYTSPKPKERKPGTEDDPAFLARDGDDKLILRTGTDELAERFHRKHESDVAAGYFAVCREYVPGGVNGKPPDKLSPAGEVVAQESPSVYQTMYRSIFERVQKPTVEASRDTLGSAIKRPNNVFFVVLRHGVLMLYDDERQLEVRYVVSLEYHNVDLFGGGDPIPESELWIKRNCIRLTRKEGQENKDKTSSRPFFLFSENQSQKEDFYFALLNNITKVPGSGPPTPQDFNTSHIIALVQRLHSTEEHMQTRWLNAMLGRFFLAMYKTPELEALIRTKLLKKIARVKKPAFITRLDLQRIDTGNGAPFITNPRLKDLDVNGNCVMEADVEYTGGARVELGATIRVDLGTRIKAREVDIVLAATCKRLQGHLLIKFKPPPSNRVWITFEKVPKVEMTLEPIVSSRQITYTFILKQIESRILEVIAETIVLPYWDDIPFLDTSKEKFRGGVWKRAVKPTTPTEIKDEVAEDEAEAGGESTRPLHHVGREDRVSTMPSISTPNLIDSTTPKKVASSLKDSILADPTKSPTKRETPRVMRSPSFATRADPMVSPSHAPAESAMTGAEAAFKRDSMLQNISMRSLGTSPESGAATPFRDDLVPEVERDRAESSASQMSAHAAKISRHNSDEAPTTNRGSGITSKANDSTESKRSSLHEDFKKFANSEQSQRTMASIAMAKDAAQKWSWGVLNRNRAPSNDGQPPAGPDGKVDTSQPMGRGQPLPPPGQPLPRPTKPSMFSIPALPKRKPVPLSRDSSTPTTPAIPSSPSSTTLSSTTSVPPPYEEKQDEISAKREPPPLPNRRRLSTLQDAQSRTPPEEEEITVVEAPAESEPSTPAPVTEDEHHDDFFGHGESSLEDRLSTDRTEESTKTRKVPPPPLPQRKFQE